MRSLIAAAFREDLDSVFAASAVRDEDLRAKLTEAEPSSQVARTRNRYAPAAMHSTQRCGGFASSMAGAPRPSAPTSSESFRSSTPSHRPSTRCRHTSTWRCSRATLGNGSGSSRWRTSCIGRPRPPLKPMPAGPSLRSRMGPEVRVLHGPLRNRACPMARVRATISLRRVRSRGGLPCSEAQGQHVVGTTSRSTSSSPTRLRSGRTRSAMPFASYKPWAGTTGPACRPVHRRRAGH